jgi:glyceraldehyde-3-phosphate dehydrogenase/erythrose-4-phosphate dehydrogenase
VARVLPYWQERVEPALMQGRTPLMVAHGNSMRGIIKFLDGISDDEIAGPELPTGQPLVYAANDIAPADDLTYLLKYGSVYGRYGEAVRHAGDHLVVGAERYTVLAEKGDGDLPFVVPGVNEVGDEPIVSTASCTTN